MSPTERRDDHLRNVEIPGRLLEEPEGQLGDEDQDLDPDEEFDDEGIEAGAETDAQGAGPRGCRAERPAPALPGPDQVRLRRPAAVVVRCSPGSSSWPGWCRSASAGSTSASTSRAARSWQIGRRGSPSPRVTNAVEAAGLTQPVVEILGGKTIEVQADLNTLSAKKQSEITDRVTSDTQEVRAPRSRFRSPTVGPTWGGQVTRHALIALIAFFIAVGVYISVRFEPKMALAAFVALLHDLLVTAGVYSLFGFQVTPDTVVAILTILGYSLYDTVVVFDRVRDNARGLGASGRHDLLRDGQPLDEPDARPVDQHLAGGDHAGARRPRHRGRVPRARSPCRTTASPSWSVF